MSRTQAWVALRSDGYVYRLHASRPHSQTMDTIIVQLNRTQVFCPHYTCRLAIHLFYCSLRGVMTPVPRIGFLDKSLRQFLMMGLSRISVQMLREISEQAHDILFQGAKTSCRRIKCDLFKPISRKMQDQCSVPNSSDGLIFVKRQALDGPFLDKTTGFRRAHRRAKFTF